jgi:hypothetical protein
MLIGIIVLLIFAATVVISILLNRRSYKKRIMKLKLEVQIKRLKQNESYWYNSSKGSLGANHPSCWAKVIGEPTIFNNTIVVIPVLLKTPTGSIETVVPTDSLTEIAQLNS